MITVILQHEVKDFSEWKKSSDADKTNRTQHGIEDKSVYASVKNPNDVTIIFEAPDDDVFEAFMANPDLEKTMREAGVISAPVSSVLNKVE